MRKPQRAILKYPEGGYYQYDMVPPPRKTIAARKGTRFGHLLVRHSPRKTRMDAFKKFFKLPAHIEPMALIVLGYGAETPEPDPDRFKKEKIHFQTW